MTRKLVEFALAVLAMIVLTILAGTFIGSAQCGGGVIECDGSTIECLDRVAIEAAECCVDEHGFRVIERGVDATVFVCVEP